MMPVTTKEIVPLSKWKLLHQDVARGGMDWAMPGGDCYRTVKTEEEVGKFSSLRSSTFSFGDVSYPSTSCSGSQPPVDQATNVSKRLALFPLCFQHESKRQALWQMDWLIR
jgi:hypothetical protein